MKQKRPRDSKKYWRSLDERANSPEFRKWVEQEFPQSADQMDNAWSRRNFLTLMAASMAMAGLAGCRRPVEKIVPFSKSVESVTPGLPNYFATTMPRGNSAFGLVVQSHEGRPTKIEGNELHPSSRGKSNLQMQAAILDLYDPDRSQSVLKKNQSATWDEFLSAWSKLSTELSRDGGAGLAILSEPFSSPTLARLKRQIEAKFPRATWTAWEPVSDENIYAGSELATGQLYQPNYNLEKAHLILSLDADFLLTESDSVSAAAGFAAGRKVESEQDRMNRLYIVESLFSVTGASADHRLTLAPDQIPAFAKAVAVALRKNGVPVDAQISDNASELPSECRAWIAPLAADLAKAGANSLIIAGRRQPAAVHALAMHLNDVLGSVGKSVKYVVPKDAVHASTESFGTLTARMKAGEVSTLILLGGNPVYNAPVDLAFKDALKNVAVSIHLSSHVDETSKEATWHIPRAHFLESWGDTRSADGTVGMVQPLIEPLFGGKPDVEFVYVLNSEKSNKGYDIVRNTWRQEWGAAFEDQWSKVLHDGVISGSNSETVIPPVASGQIANALRGLEKPTTSGALQVVFHADNCLNDGAGTNNGWLQELPDPITKLSWDNVATICPATANRLGLKNEDMVRLSLDSNELSMPIWIVPGQADNVVGLPLGYGRTNSGRVGDGVGFDTFTLRTSSALHYSADLMLTPTGRKYELANTQDHGSMEGRPIVREASLEEYRSHPKFAAEAVTYPPLKSLWEDHKYDQGYQWGMAIDLTKCVGCNVCTIACQSENNIPIVGKSETRNGREMHWIRLDRYFVGDVDNPQIVHQPVACHHCETAPCEQVCPVAATVHDTEGLNAMVYNRCIGTRYCANNCPYKVRRFNFFNLTKDMPEVTKMAQNPEVTVRSRGVMEKCSYCVQRITAAKRTAKLEGREVQDGEVKAACQQACPSGAIVFGDINDPNSEVSRVKKQNRSYDLLAELNLRPRTSYLAKIRNPNPEMPS